MRTTWTQTPKPAFAAIKGDIDALPSGAFLTSCRYAPLNIVCALQLTQFFSAPFYGPSFNAANLEPAFSTITPEFADRTFLSVKGRSVPFQLVADVSEENLGSSVRVILKALLGTKRLDLFMPGTLDSNHAIEHSSEVLNEMAKERKT
jgi:pyridoxine 4-dehydrogenase